MQSLKLEEKKNNYTTDWISNEASRKLVHKWRSEEQGIMVGTNTVLLDNPRLTVREYEGKNPIRVIIDKWLRVPTHYHIHNLEASTLIFSEMGNSAIGNVEVIKIDFNKDIIAQIMEELYRRAILSVMVEGGELLFNAFIQNNCWDEARVLVANKEFKKGIKAPDISGKNVIKKEYVFDDELLVYQNNQ